jgi:hypothetical protein
MTPELISKTIKAALQKWSFAADLTFTELKEGEADIMIVFTAGKHGDRYDFDGRGKALAHAFYPGSQNTGKYKAWLLTQVKTNIGYIYCTTYTKLKCCKMTSN